MNNYKYLISIDPAGIGHSGTIIIDLASWTIIFKDTYKSVSVTEAKNYFIQLFQTLNESKVCVWVEDVFLRNKITNPLATPKLIGALQVITEDLFEWKFGTYQPKEKQAIIVRYQGNMKLTGHETDAFKGAIVWKEKNGK
ncbi:hypothetical protein LT336_00749 [Spiroplasma sp. JKS002671]|nr:hypothetical protein [Spiroplasma sp. JKS002671]MCL8210997.1 hypothetical protein [Spiroplasma sp. JKS002671]